MKALVFEKFQGPIQLCTVTDPEPRPHGVVVQVTATGLCRSDWHGWMGHDPDIRLPHVPGHELAGHIAAVGKDVKRFKTGDRVTVPFVCACGACPQCDSGNQQVCDNQTQPGFTNWGSFAEYVALEHADINLVHLPDEIDDLSAALLGCRFITSYRAIAHQGNIQPGQWVAIHGCGGVGLSAVMIAKALGAQVIAIDINTASLDLARDLGADITINTSSNIDPVEAIRSTSNGGVHVSMDALGSQSTCFNSIACLQKRGKHLQVGLMAGKEKHPSIPMDQVIAHELEILGSHGMQAFKYSEVFQLISEGKLDLKQFISKTISLKEASRNLSRMHTFEYSGVQIINTFT